MHSSSSPVAGGISRGPGRRPLAAGRNEVTDIIPFNDFGSLDQPDFTDPVLTDPVLTDPVASDSAAQLLEAPELDDLHDTDNLIALRLPLPVDYDTYVSELPTMPLPISRAKHRSPSTSAVKSRVMVAAMAAGAAAAAAHAVTHSGGTKSEPVVLAAGDSIVGDEAGHTGGHGLQMITVKQTANAVLHNEELAKGVAFAQERAEREARLQRPLFVAPTRGTFTSNFGYRWGVMHAGIDIANAIGTPILAASDGVVIEAGPSAGYGMLVKLRHSDGTVTLYGHINRSLVSVGEQVMAGDQIAEMGNRGYSTGPHLHFEVLQGGTSRVDPSAWLAKRGITVV